MIKASSGKLKDVVTCRVLGNVFASMRLFHFEVRT